MKKTATVMKLVFSILGMLTGMLSVIAGILVSDSYYASWSSTNKAFGGDFYTYSYGVTANAANNVRELGETVESIGCWLLVIAGLVILFSFGMKLFEALGEMPKREPKPKRAAIPVQPGYGGYPNQMPNQPGYGNYPNNMYQQNNNGYIPQSQMPRDNSQQ